MIRGSMRVYGCTGPSRLCLGMVIVLLTLAVPPTRGEELPDDILELTQQMVERERVGDYAAAVTSAHKALTIAEEALGPEASEVAIYSDYLGMLHLRVGHTPAAAGLFLRALAIREQVLGADHLVVAITLRHLAETYRRSGEAAKAVIMLERALAIDEQAFGVDHAFLATTLQRLGLIFLNEGRYAESEPLLLRALHLQDDVDGVPHPRIATTLEYYARLLRETDRRDAAIHTETRIQGMHTANMK